MKIYWKRFWSDTPEALKKLQKILGSISAGLGTISAGLLIYDDLKYIATIAGVISIVLGGICTGLQLSTTDKNLQNQ